MHIYDHGSHIKPMTLSSAQTALARHHAYTLFSRLFLEGVTAELRPFLSPIPELVVALPDLFDADESAATHYHLFQLNLFPYESIFLATDGLLGGPITNKVQQQYEQSGFTVDASATSPDHIGQELAFLAYLCGAEANAWEDGLGETPALSTVEVAVSIQNRQHTFLQHHLLRWLTPFVLAVQAQEVAFYSGLAELMLTFVADHAENANLPVHPHVLPDLPFLLDNDKTSLKDIAHYLITPAYSGFFLSRDQISHIARQHQLPRGFGSRTQMLTNLMKTAVQYDVLPALLQTIQQHTIDQETAFCQTGTAHPHLTAFITPWQTRLKTTRNMLQAMQEQTQSDK